PATASTGIDSGCCKGIGRNIYTERRSARQGTQKRERNGAGARAKIKNSAGSGLLQKAAGNRKGKLYKGFRVRTGFQRIGGKSERKAVEFAFPDDAVDGLTSQPTCQSRFDRLDFSISHRPFR